MASDAPAWLSAEQAKIDNHQNNSSWSVIDRSQLPPGRGLVRLIWVYRVTRDGSKKARLWVYRDVRKSPVLTLTKHSARRCGAPRSALSHRLQRVLA
eukprot:5122379-Pleurochrysis_carterae.AAC.1